MAPPRRATDASARVVPALVAALAIIGRLTDHETKGTP
jgi:hypothetical protein